MNNQVDKNILIVDPSELIIDHYKEWNNIIIWKSENYIINKNNINTIFKNKNFNELDHETLITKIKELNPLWMRWITNSFEYEMIIRQALIYCLYIRNFVIENKINAAIFHTSVCHHINDNLVQMVLSELNIPQIFIYGIPLCNRLLPLIQVKDISDRKPLNFDVSEYSLKNDLEDFTNNLKKNKPPILNSKITNLRKNSYFAKIYWLKFIIFSLLKNNTKVSQLTFTDELGSNSLKYGFSVINNQKKALDFYLDNIDNNAESNILAQNTISLLIAAHYQPEATTFPEGGWLNNYIDQIIRIRLLGYKDIIYFKEHPGSFLYSDKIVGLTRVGVFRSVDFYKSLLAMGCVFLHPNISIGSLSKISDKILPITMTGTIALERSLLGKKTIITGYPWYKGLPGTYELKHLNIVISKISKNIENIKVDTINFLHKLINKKSILNVPGIATGIPLNDPKEIMKFLEQFDKLIFHLSSKFKL